MTEVLLRPATPADTPALSRLGTDSFVAAFGHLYSKADLAAFLAEHKSEAATAAQIGVAGAPIQVAEQDGKLLGYCKLGFDCGYPQHARGRNVMELRQLYLDPTTTGQGIGAKLMDWAMDTFDERLADEVQLSVWSGNFGAQRFYARYGFEKVADVTFRVGDQIDDEFLFARLLG